MLNKKEVERTDVQLLYILIPCKLRKLLDLKTSLA